MTTFAAGDEPTAAQINDIGPRYAYKSSDETVNTNATLQNDDFMLLTVAASTKYDFEIFILYNTGVTPDLKLGWTLPTGASNVYGYQYWDGTIWNASSGVTVPTAGFQLSGFAADIPARIFGTISVSTTPGTMQVVWAQQTSTGSNTTIRAGSYLKLTKIP